MTGRRLALTAVLAASIFGGVGLVPAPPASAHPLGNFTVNRYSGLTLAPGGVTVHYVLDMAEIPTFQETPNIDADGDGTVTSAERAAWADRKAPDILAHLSLSVDGRPVQLHVVSAAMRFRPGQAGLPILYFTATFAGPLPGASGSVDYADRNYQGRIGWREVTVRSGSGVAITGSNVPASSVSHELLAYPKDLLSSPLAVDSARFSFHPGAATTGSLDRQAGDTVSGAPIASGGSFARLVGWRLTPLVLAVSLLLAFVFGAVHALGPGHGKTITAAYLVGAGAKRRQAAVIGVAVSLMHTGSVLALGLVALQLARSFPPERIYPWLELVTGLVALGLGTGLFVVRLRARRRGEDPWHGHTHPWDHVAVGDLDVPVSPVAGHHEHGHGGHSHVRELRSPAAVAVLDRPEELNELDENHEADDRHVHDHTHEHADPAATAASAVSRPRLLALAVAGGILPSPTAFVVLLGAIHAHRVGYGLTLILAFSIGLAAALVFVGLFALRARSLVSSRLKGRWTGLIPVLSAAVIMGFGLFFATRGISRIG